MPGCLWLPLTQTFAHLKQEDNRIFILGDMILEWLYLIAHRLNIGQKQANKF